LVVNAEQRFESPGWQFDLLQLLEQSPCCV
jgi:hypothetical protein